MEKVENPGTAAIAHGTKGLSDSCANRIAPSAPFQFTIVTSRIPATITKTMTFGQDGDLIKGAAGNLVEGDAKIVCANDHAAFIEILVALRKSVV